MTTESLLLANCLRRNIFFSLSGGGGSLITRCVCVSPLYTQSSSSVCSELSPCHDNYIHYVMVSCIFNDWSHISARTGTGQWTAGDERVLVQPSGTLILYTTYLHRDNTVGIHSGGEHGLQKWGPLGFYDRRQIPCFGSSIYFKGALVFSERFLCYLT